MIDGHELTEHDQKLLKMIEAALENRDQEYEDQTDPFYAFCVHLANAVPQADAAFREELESRLLSELEQRQRDTAGKLRTLPADLRPQLRSISIPALDSVIRRARPARLPHLMPRPLTAWAAIGLVIIAILVIMVPGLHTAAAQTIREIGHLLSGGASATEPNGMVALRPVPSFTVKQPRYLPEGLKRTAILYQPSVDSSPKQPQPNVQEQRIPVEPHSLLDVQPPVESVHENEGYLLLTYAAHNGRTLRLFQRARRPGETLPAGVARTVGDQPARLLKNGQTLTLIWIDGETWIEMSGTLREAELMRVAENLITTHFPALSEHQHDISEGHAEVPYCNPDARLPGPPRLGEAVGQQLKGSVLISLMTRKQAPESVEYTTYVPHASTEILERALAALQNPELAMQPLSYPALTFTRSRTVRGLECLRPDPKEQGYIIIEVWTHEVNVGYGGEGIALKVRAIEALAEKLQEVQKQLSP